MIVYCFRLAGPRYQHRREKRNVRPQIRHVLSRKGEDQPVAECLAKVSSSNPRVEDRRQGVAAERSEERLSDAFQRRSIHDTDRSGDGLTVPHQSGRESLENTSCVLPQLDKIFAPGPIIYCPKCKTELRVFLLFSGRL